MTTDSLKAARERLGRIAEGCAITAVYGPEWTTFPDVEMRKDLRVVLHPLTDVTPVAFQQRVQPWMMECFGAKISSDMLERADRFTEEALELAQTVPSFTAARAHALVDYVFGRDVGERQQEVGGVMVTLAALCLAAGEDMHQAAEVELARITQPHVVQKIRAKQAAKPTGSALPVRTEHEGQGS